MNSPRTEVQPSAGEARRLVESGLEQGAVVALFGRCAVEYEGRAVSTLGAGDRLLILKSDGTALVHTDEGQQPINWQPPGSAHEVRTEDGDLVVTSQRSAPAEVLAVHFERIDHAVAYDGSDGSELELSGTEDDLRQRILAEPSLIEPDFEPRATERDTPAGAVDIFGTDAGGTAVAVELKRRRVGPDAVGQLARYVDALERDLHAGRAVRGILVAPSVTDRARQLLADRGLEFVPLEPPE